MLRNNFYQNSEHFLPCLPQLENINKLGYSIPPLPYSYISFYNNFGG